MEFNWETDLIYISANIDQLFSIKGLFWVVQSCSGV